MQAGGPVSLSAMSVPPRTSHPPQIVTFFWMHRHRCRMSFSNSARAKLPGCLPRLLLVHLSGDRGSTAIVVPIEIYAGTPVGEADFITAATGNSWRGGVLEEMNFHAGDRLYGQAVHGRFFGLFRMARAAARNGCQTATSGKKHDLRQTQMGLDQPSHLRYTQIGGYSWQPRECWCR
jgi:hypothetical protein